MLVNLDLYTELYDKMLLHLTWYRQVSRCIVKSCWDGTDISSSWIREQWLSDYSMGKSICSWKARCLYAYVLRVFRFGGWSDIHQLWSGQLIMRMKLNWQRTGSVTYCWQLMNNVDCWTVWYFGKRIIQNKKAQLSLTNLSDVKTCQKLLQFDVLNVVADNSGLSSFV